MCGRFALVSSAEELLQRFGVGAFADMDGDQLARRWNAAPSQQLATIYVNHEGTKGLGPMRWGFMPPWGRPKDRPGGLINARGETLAEKASFRAAFRETRAIVPATAFYEWKKAPGGGEPWAFAMEDHRPFGIAALWGMSKDEDDDAPQRACALITVAPNPLVTPIHARMPAILSPEDYEAWLDPDRKDPEDLTRLLKPFPASGMDAWRVSAVVNSPRNDDPRCLEPVLHHTEELF